MNNVVKWNQQFDSNEQTESFFRQENISLPNLDNSFYPLEFRFDLYNQLGKKASDWIDCYLI